MRVNPLVGAPQWDFMKRAQARPEQLKRAHSLHVWNSIAGGALFALEEVAPRVPLIHTAW